jgi:hypothetical protein
VSKTSKYEIRSFTKDGFIIFIIEINSCLIFENDENKVLNQFSKYLGGKVIVGVLFNG